MKMRIIGTLITILGLSVSWGQTDLCRPSVFKDGSIWKGSDVIEMFTLTNASGMSIKVTNYAASLTDVSVPDRQGQFEHVVLGFDSLESYLERHPKFGATVGRFANRIRNAEFSLNGQTYHLEKNNKEHSIHGGTNGFNRQVFKTDTFYTVKDTAIVVFKYKSTHLEGGFPGNIYNPQIQISAESETKRSIFREKDKTKRSKKESAQHSKSRNKSFVMTSVSAL